MASEVNQLWRFEEFEIDASNRLLTVQGEHLFLHARTFDLLLYMVRNPGRLLTKEELMNAVWGDTAVEESNLTQNVFMLRKALAPKLPEDRKLIITVQGRGYRFDADVRDVPAAVRTLVRMDGEADEGKAPSAPVSPAGPKKRGVFRYAPAAGAAVAILAAAGWYWYTRAVPGDHHEIVLADFDDATDDPGVDRALDVALAIDLNQSPFLLVTPDAKIRRTLTLMERSPQEKLTTGLAREVCQRIDGQAVLAGAIARFGKKYLITLTASDCAGGQDLAQTKAMADQLDDVPGAVDSVAADMRRQLGEPLRSRRRFNKPLLAKRTGSLDALKAYSQGHEIGWAGRFQEAIPFLRKAVELDPKFAIAWGYLGVIYDNVGEPALSAEATRKAWELHDLADERDRLYIEATYHEHVTRDLHETIRAYEQYTDTYAHDSSAWANLASQQTEIGRPDLSIDPAKRAIAVEVDNGAAYVILARAQMRTGQLDEALATCHQAVVQKVDGADIHGLMLSIAFAQGDKPGIDEQLAWAKGTSSEPFMTLQQFLMTFAEGRPRSAAHLLAQLIDGYRKRGMLERATRMNGGLPRLEAELGMTDAARQLLQNMTPIDGSTDMPVAMAEVGDTARAEAILQHDLKEFPEATLWQYVRGPQIRAAIALSRNDPGAAIEALRPAIPYDRRSSELPAMRGRAYLAAGRFREAEAEFRKITEHPTLDPLSGNVALAHLGLARARAGAGDPSGSREEYERFFEMLKNAETDVPVLQAAKIEFARLGP